MFTFIVIWQIQKASIKIHWKLFYYKKAFQIIYNFKIIILQL